jgi:hypothetical protein
MLKRILSVFMTVICLLPCLTCWAQDSTAAKKPAMADALRASGKIYVVVAVLVTILAGVVIYVARLDWKISKMENNR